MKYHDYSRKLPKERIAQEASPFRVPKWINSKELNFIPLTFAVCDLNHQKMEVAATNPFKNQLIFSVMENI